MYASLTSVWQEVKSSGTFELNSIQWVSQTNPGGNLWFLVAGDAA